MCERSPGRLDSEVGANEHADVIAPILQRAMLATLLALQALSGLAAQSVVGRVSGLHGGPAVGATVSAFDRDGKVLTEVLVDGEGRFELFHSEPVARIVVQREAIWVGRAVPAGKCSGFDFDLSKERHWTMRGHLVDPEGTMAVGVDVLARDADGKALASVTTNAKGAFVLRSNQMVASLVAAPLGWRHVCAGPFDRSRGLAIDLRLHRDQYKLLHGRLLGLDGQPIAGARVTAKSKERRELLVCAMALTKPDGTWRLWTTRDVVELTAVYAGEEWQRPGNWGQRTHGELVLDAKRDGIVRVRGTLLDRDGKPISHAVIYASNKKKLANRATGIAATNVHGNFVVSTRRATPFLIALNRRGKVQAVSAGPWSGEPVKMRAK